MAEMYQMRKVFNVPDNIKLPDTMYRLRPVNANLNLQSSTASGANDNTAVMNGHADKAERVSVLKETNKNEVKRKSESELQLDPKDTRKTKRKRSKSPMDKGKLMDTSPDAVETSQKLMDELEKRQKAVIARLLKLKDALDGKVSLSDTVQGDSNGNVADGGVPNVDAVVHADPENPPLSVLLLVKELQKSYNGYVECSSHVHSSCGGMTEAARKFNDDLVKVKANGQGKNTVGVTVIWRKQNEPALVADANHPALEGEANIGRYLSRLLPASHPLNYDNLQWDDVLNVDGLLEKCSSAPEKSLDLLEKQLGGKTGWLFGERSLADIVLFSVAENQVLKNKGAVDKYKAVKAWLGRTKAN